MIKTIDINCDMGESYLSTGIGNDEKIMPLISSCNIATGFHGGDPMTIYSTMDLAINHNIRIGAHPSYPDIEGFGRRAFNCKPSDLYHMIIYQLGGFMALLLHHTPNLHHVKAHGQLYKDIQQNKNLASAFVSAIQEINPKLAIYGMPNSELSNICRIRMMPFIGEGFIDRSYQVDGQLVPRKEVHAVITDHKLAAQQALTLLKDPSIQTLCVHGDNIAAADILKEVHEVFSKAEVSIKSQE